LAWALKAQEPFGEVSLSGREHQSTTIGVLAEESVTKQKHKTGKKEIINPTRYSPVLLCSCVVFQNREIFPPMTTKMLVWRYLKRRPPPYFM
jgi:hypothetical protein